MDYSLYNTHFKINLLEGANFDGDFDFPVIHKTKAVPNSVLAFDKCLSCKNFNKWIHFFIHDNKFQRVIKNPQRYLDRLSKFDGVFSPDCSLFWNYPLWKQVESIGNSRTIGSWLQRNGINVIPTVRWGKEETWSFCFDGIEKGGSVAVGTHGAMKNIESKKVFADGFKEMIKRLEPTRIVVYGTFNAKIFEPATNLKIPISHFESEISIVMRGRKNGNR